MCIRDSALARDERLSFVRYDLSTPDEVPFAAEEVGALVIIANYVFDTLPVDVFRTTDGVLEEGLAVIRSTQPESLPLSTEAVGRVALSYAFQPIPDDVPVYGEPILDGIVSQYPSRLEEAAFTIPVAGITALQALLRACSGAVMLLTADKGHSHLHQMDYRQRVAPRAYGGLTYMVNFDAISLFFESHGGEAVLFDPREGSLEGGVFVSRPLSPIHRMEIADLVGGFGIADFYQLHQRLQEEGTLSIEDGVALLHLSAYDPTTLMLMKDDLMGQLKLASGYDVGMLLRAMDRVWENAFPSDEHDLGLVMGEMYQELGVLGLALQRYQDSIELFGEKPETRFHMGICFERFGQQDRSIWCFERVLEMSPGHGPAQRNLERLKARHQKT